MIVHRGFNGNPQRISSEIHLYNIMSCFIHWISSSDYFFYVGLRGVFPVLGGWFIIRNQAFQYMFYDIVILNLFFLQLRQP